MKQNGYTLIYESVREKSVAIFFVLVRYPLFLCKKTHRRIEFLLRRSFALTKETPGVCGRKRSLLWKKATFCAKAEKFFIALRRGSLPVLLPKNFPGFSLVTKYALFM